MNRILFVDDERRVLDGLQRMLYTLRKEWDMTFVSSGAEALQCLSESRFDVLVTDVRMPEMSGIALLEQVVERHPQVVRMVLSGTADMELTLQSVSLAHQYLMKPCDAQTLRATVQRALCLRLLLHNPGMRDKLSQLQSLPSIPAIYVELVEALQSGDASPKVVGEIVSRDMGMTAKVLQLVNSAFFGIRREITSPLEAVVYLGMETIQALVFSVSAFSQFPVRGASFSIEKLQEHSLAVGTLARQIAKSMHLSPVNVEHAFIGGLLHDIGKLVLASHYPEQYQLLQRTAVGSIPVGEAESNIFGTSHGEIGAYLLWLWGLPDPVTEILAMHHHPSRDMNAAPTVVAVHVADALVGGSEIDLDCLRMLGLEKEVDGWRQLYEG